MIMANRALFFSLVSMFLALLLSASPAQLAGGLPCAVQKEMQFQEAARVKFECSSARALEGGAGEREFKIKHATLASPAPETLPWKAIDPFAEPQRYVKALLDYGIKDNKDVDWRIEENQASNWCHAPWFHDERERLRGMTRERGSRPFELHVGQASSKENWAIGVYNDIACQRLALMWQNPTFPKTKDFAFPEGSYAIKLLFTSATPAEVPYLAGSMEWRAALGDKGIITTMRLLQVDVAVKDGRASATSGWFFGTFIYDAATPGNTPYERLTPVGLSWGNDPTLNAADYELRGKTVKESWVNPAVAAKFFGLPRHNLGLFGRLNGPVDNPKSSCVACHGRALDWGRAIMKGSLAEQIATLQLPMFPTDPYDNGELGQYFRNLGTAPFVKDTQPLDYSLQVAKGVEFFRAWVFANYKDMAGRTTDVPQYGFPTDPFEAPQRQTIEAPPTDSSESVEPIPLEQSADFFVR